MKQWRPALPIVLVVSLITTLLAATPMASATPDPYADEVTVSTPKGWWRFSETSGSTAYSEVGGHHATVAAGAGEASQGWRGAGETGTSMRFADGGSALLPGSVNGDVANYNYSVECWVYVERLPARSNCMTVGSQTAPKNGFEFGVGHGTTPNADLVFRSYRDDGSAFTFTAQGAAQVGWNHFVAALGGGKVRLYRNGVESHVGSWQTQMMATPTTPGAIGGTQSSSRIDEVAHYKRTLTPTEVLDHFAAGVSAFGPVDVAARRLRSVPELEGYGLSLSWAPYDEFSPAGYRVLRNGVVVDSLPPSATSYLADDPEMSGGWSIVAYSGSDESADVPVAPVAPIFRVGERPGSWLGIPVGIGVVAGASADLQMVIYHTQEPLTGQSQTPGRYHLYAHDRSSGELRRLDGVGGVEPSESAPRDVEVSADGSYVAFGSKASNLVPDDTNAIEDVFRWNTRTGGVDLVSADLDGTWDAIYNSASGVHMSVDGSQVYFHSLRSLAGTSRCKNNSSSPTYSSVYARHFPTDGSGPFTRNVTEGFPGSACPTGVRAVSPSGRFVLMRGQGWDWWLVDQDADGQGAVTWVPVPGPDGQPAVWPGSGMIYGAAITEPSGRSPEVLFQLYTLNRPCNKCTLGWEIGTTQSHVIHNAQDYALTTSSDGRFVVTAGLHIDRDPDDNGVFDEAGSVKTPLEYFTPLPVPADSEVGPAEISYDGRFVLSTSKDHRLLGPEDTPGTPDVLEWDFRPGDPASVPYTQTQSYREATTGYIADPIVASTGAFIHTEPLLDFGAPAAALNVTAHYNHQDPVGGAAGVGWTLPFDTRLEFTEDSIGDFAALRTATGDYVVFRDRGSEWESVTEGDTTTLVEVTGGWERRHIDGTVEAFDDEGRWASTEFWDDSTLTVTRDGQGLATRVEHSTGFGYDITWSSGRVTGLEADDGRTVQFTYGDAGLRAVSFPDGRAALYSHDAAGRIERIDDASRVEQPSPGFSLAHKFTGGRLYVDSWIPSRTSLTAEAWVQTPSAPLNGENGYAILGKHGSDPVGEFYVGLLDTGALRFLTRSSAGADVYDVPVTWADDVPHHVAATWDGTTKRLYLDGVEVGSGKAWSGTLVTTSQRIWLGSVLGGLTFTGHTIDEAALYDEALTPSQVAEHHRLGTAPLEGEDYAADGPLTNGADALWRLADLANEVPEAPAMIRTGAVPTTAGLLASGVTSRMVLANTYDLANRATSQTNSSGARTTINYNAAPTDPSRPRVTEVLDEVTGDVTRLEMLTNGTVAQTVGADGIARARIVSNGQLTGLAEASDVQSFVRDPATGAVTEWVRHGATVEVDFDAVDRPTTVTVAGVDVVTFDYELPDTAPGARRDRHPVSFTDAENNTAALAYDTVGGARRLVSMTDPDGVVTTFTYNSAGLLVEAVVDPTGEELTTSWTYTDAGRVASITLPGGRTWVHTYDEVGRPLTLTDPEENVTEWEWSELGDLLSVDAAGSVTSYTWRGDGWLESTTDPDGVVTAYGYNAAGEITSITVAPGTPDEATTVLELGPMARVDAVVDPTGRRVEFVYDHAGRVLERRSVGDVVDGDDDLVELWTYNSAGQVLTYTDATEAVTTNVYDSFGRLVSTTDPTGVESTWSFDTTGRVLEAVEAGATTEFSWTDAGRIAEVLDADGVTREYVYDTAGRVVEIDDATSITEIVYGTDGLPATVTTDGAATTFTRDHLGRVTTSTGPAGTTQATFDPAGNVTELTRGTGPEAGTWTYTYSDAGRLTEVLDPVGTHTVYGFDDAGREVSRTVDTELIEERSFDAAGRLLSIDALASGLTTFSFDDHGRHVATTDATGRSTALTLDAAGRVLESVSTGPGDPVEVTYTFDEAGRPTSITDGSSLEGELTTTWLWDTDPAVAPEDPAPTGHLLSRTDPNGVLTYTWTDAGRLASRTVAPATGPPKAETYDYTDGRLSSRTSFDDGTPVGTSTYAWTGGFLTAETHPGLDRTRSYDALGRLADITNDDGTAEAFELTYDTWGRPATQVRSIDNTPTQTLTWTYDAAGQLTAADDSTGPARTWAWDAGRLTAEEVGAAEHTYTWTGGRVTAADLDGVDVEFTYDAAGRQIGWHGLAGGSLTTEVDVTRSFDAAGRLIGASRTGDGTWVEARSYHAGRLDTVAIDDGVDEDTTRLWWDDGDLALSPTTQFDPSVGLLPTLVATALPDADWGLIELGPLTGGPGGPNAPPPRAVGPFGGDSSAQGADPFAATSRDATAFGISGVDLSGPAPLVHLQARDADRTLFITPDPLAALPGTAEVANAYAAHGNSPTTTWDFSGLRPDYGSRYGLLTTTLEAVSVIPGVDTFADMALCGLEISAQVGGKGNAANLAMSCGAVVLPGVGAGAMRSGARVVKALDKANVARRSTSQATSMLIPTTHRLTNRGVFALFAPAKSNSANARILRRNLEAAGHVARPGDEAHHMVKSGGRRHDDARKRMAQLGVDVNDAENGVFLPGTAANRAAGDTRTVHRGEGIHSKAYDEHVWEMVQDAETRDDLVRGLSCLRDCLLRGEHPWK